MNILIACEFSGITREAFRRRGHNVWSCDFLPSEREGQHLQMDVKKVLHGKWDMMITFPPCTHLAVSGARWFKDKEHLQAEALAFAQLLLSADIPRICLENPVSVISTRIRKPDQIIHPWMFGHNEEKTTCLWLKGLPKLHPTNLVEGRYQRIWRLPPSSHRWKDRSRTLPGVAEAMASQWG